jgi:transcriptional regulator with XRE-family HTH domain
LGRPLHDGADIFRFAAYLKAEREGRGITMRQAALGCGVEGETWGGWEKAERLPSLVNFKKVCDWLDESPEYLLSLIGTIDENRAE